MSDSAVPRPRGWLNPTVLGAGLTSFLSDVCYEMATAVLPSFLQLLGLPAAALIGIIEGTADATANFAKLGAGWYSDRLGRRKPLVVLGYALSGASQAFYALGWPVILVAKIVGWLGKGIRGPLRNAILADAVAPQDRGKAFGLHRAGDTIGAVLGPLIGFAILRWLPPSTFGDDAGTFRFVFLLTLIPGLGAVATFALLVHERRLSAQPGMKFWGSLRELPKPFRTFLVGVGVFGLGAFTDKLLIVAATRQLIDSKVMAPGPALAFGALLYACRNLSQALVALPIGALSDRVGPRIPLLGGFLLGVAVMLAFAAVAHFQAAGQAVFLALFAAAGVYLAAEEALEGVLTADLVPDRQVRGTAYGLIGSVNGVGDLLSSLAAGLLMEYLSIPAAFLYAAALMLLGTLLLLRVTR